MADDSLASLAKTALKPLNKFVQTQIERLPTNDAQAQALHRVPATAKQSDARPTLLTAG
jgi:hypothetical protein